MDISIIICTRNRGEDLKRTLLSLADLQTPAGCKCELIVVDNGSTNSMQDVVRESEPKHILTKVVVEPSAGLSRARNAGVRASCGDILLFTDDDVRLPTTWIERMIYPIRRGEAQAVMGGVKIAPHLERAWMKEKHRASLADTSLRDTPAKHELIGANMALSREVFRDIPEFDIELGAGTPRTGEETLFSFQLLEAGYTIAPMLDPPVEHHFDPSRLRRESFLSEAARVGRFFAYFEYHWLHHDVPAFPLRRMRSRLRLAVWRGLHLRAKSRVEGVSVQEMECVFSVAYYDAFLEQLGTDRKYDRGGLSKRRALLTPPSVAYSPAA